MAGKGSAQKRFMRVIDLWQVVHPDRNGFTTEEVAEFAVKQGLHPVPGLRDAKLVCEAWDEKFQAIKAKLLNALPTPNA
jgi:hypothetical protein